MTTQALIKLSRFQLTLQVLKKSWLKFGEQVVVERSRTTHLITVVAPVDIQRPQFQPQPPVKP
jgi:hypothetical protein